MLAQCYLPLTLTPCIAQSAAKNKAQNSFQGLISDLEGLENRLQMPGDPSVPMIQRLSRLEVRLFGAPRSGSMVERLQSIKSAVNEMSAKPAAQQEVQIPAQPPANSIAGPDFPPIAANPTLNAAGHSLTPNAHVFGSAGFQPAPASSELASGNSGGVTNSAQSDLRAVGINPNVGTSPGAGWTPPAVPGRDFRLTSTQELVGESPRRSCQ